MDAIQTANVRGSHTVMTSIAFTVIGTVFVIVRCIARFGLVRICGADDILILCSLAVSIAFTSLVAGQAQYGLGSREDSLGASERAETLQLFWASVITYNLGLALIKSSILCQFLRFLVGNTVRRMCYGMLTVVILNGICSTLVSALVCIPVPYFWDKTIQGGYCIDLMAFWFSNAAFSIISDFSICVLPIPVLKSLQLPRKQKFCIIVVFAMGGFGCIVSILRLYSLYIVAGSVDITWDNVGAATWSSGELNVGIACACLPTFRPILNRLFPRLLLRKQPFHVEPLRDAAVRQGLAQDSDGRPIPTNVPCPCQSHQLENLNWKDINVVVAEPTHHEGWLKDESPQESPV